MQITTIDTGTVAALEGSGPERAEAEVKAAQVDTELCLTMGPFRAFLFVPVSYNFLVLRFLQLDW